MIETCLAKEPDDRTVVYGTSEVQPLAPTALGRLIETCLAKEPDDRTVVYGSSDGEVNRLYARPLDSFDTTPVASSEGIGGNFLLFSPDSRHVAFTTREDDGATLYRLSLAGGGRRRIGQNRAGLPGRGLASR